MAAAAAGVFHRPLLLGNVGEVDPGRVYRCAQPKGNLAELLESYRPGSVLNLRGGSYADSWYADEVEATDRLGIDFYDFPMSATRRPSRAELLALIDLLERCRYPLLIHCKSGADRTGLVSGLYLMVVVGRPPEEALEAFSLRYGHVPIGGPERLHEPFEEYRDWLKAEGREHSPERFRSWVDREYRDDDPNAPRTIAPLRPGPRMGPPPSGLADRRRREARG
ncbi:protein tyrosine phosphatase [Tautonia sociabilis]|uniref:Protein tyrosine phosphatase n=1 Tax=Tautonia sociabilis TaxID=2080755 RepID=A0A432MBR8_9BACT|nr:protein tyrosine phosphatase [Tautonia sociabilis]